MFVPTMETGPLTDENQRLMPQWKSLLEQLLQNMQQALSNEGFLIPPQTTVNVSALEGNVQAGTLIFNSSLVNGGTVDAPNGQLMVMLADGIFHPVVNT